jgi:predicted phosphodiesterase
MRTAIISDIHANLAALERVLETAETLGVDQIHCLGDIVGYGPFPNECVELVRTHCTLVVKGNHDSGATGETPMDHFNDYGKNAIRWTRKHLSPANVEYLRSLPLIETQDATTLVHSSPVQPEEWQYVVTWADAHDCFTAFPTPLCFIGHTHVPVLVSDDGQINVYRPGHRHLMNVGSVGQPRDANPRASFGLHDPDRQQLEIIRITYDVEVTAKAILEARMPDYLAQRLFVGI